MGDPLYIPYVTNAITAANDVSLAMAPIFAESPWALHFRHRRREITPTAPRW
jgi:hypothetical protein